MSRRPRQRPVGGGIRGWHPELPAAPFDPELHGIVRRTPGTRRDDGSCQTSRLSPLSRTCGYFDHARIKCAGVVDVTIRRLDLYVPASIGRELGRLLLRAFGSIAPQAQRSGRVGSFDSVRQVDLLAATQYPPA
jgi:hypothetical protein